MTSFIRDLYGFFMDSDEALNHLPAILDQQAAEQSLGNVRFSNEWLQQRAKIDECLAEKSDESLTRALKIFAKVIDTLDLYAPALKGLTDVHAYACETLESIIFDQQKVDQRGQAAAFLYGQAMAMSSLTAEAVTLAIENLGNNTAANLALCIILGVERSSPTLFESHLPELLQQVQMAAFDSDATDFVQDKSVPQEALIRALKIYCPSEKVSSCRMILQATHTIFVASLHLCQKAHKAEEGVFWTCFLIEHMPMMLRNDLAHRYPQTMRSIPIFTLLLPLGPRLSPASQASLCSALPLLATWETSLFVDSEWFTMSIHFMLGTKKSLRAEGLKGLGQMASVVLDRFEPFLDEIGEMALGVLDREEKPAVQKAAQRLLACLLASQGPTTLDIMIHYLRSPHHILLADVELLEMIATLLPNLARRIIQTLTDIIDDLLTEKGGAEEGDVEGRGSRRASVLDALNVFPLRDRDLTAKAQKLVLWSLEEDSGQPVVVAALQLSTNPIIATPSVVRSLTFKVAQLLLADDPYIVHTALSVLSNPALASMLDKSSCSMILLALHQSMEPSIQIIAAKLLAHLTTAHKAIVQPLAWSHIRQSLSLIDFLHSVDPTKAIIEACIISNLLPALPPSLHKKYVGPVKELIMTGLHRPCEPPTLSLIFQGLSNLAHFESYTSAQQSQLAQELLEKTQEIPKECQHAALNAISSLLSVPKEGLDVYELLIKVHARFGGGRGKTLDNDLKALVSGIYGHLGTVERNPVISRDSKAAINRETLNYPSKVAHLSRIAEVRDRHGPLNQTSINTLLAEILSASLSTSLKATDDRSLVLETMSCLGILQPHSIPSLIPDLPGLIMSELRYALKSRDAARDANSASVSAGLLFLSSTVHTSGIWLEQYWQEMGELMVECISSGEALPVLRGLDVILGSLRD
ncbi:hypothetical protein L198_05696 [Cryptococcus wingfieldii CBS 7118]|uniref:Uncharacterized protein n=1 Tax=Cryptococcus wingfieldii CBS 7118 TaxID=1295528 RepID=A0A1E3ITT6_9TREE|nr:hypothetical protein L198_05696 [Cryptococcus wingfieldii CBS 7118]ODN92024.1 hypothetical protein L198_05696 [Cryptococcus wingfieldii CBS 7118]